MRWLWIGLGHLCLVLGFIGIFLPLLPTTPFVLLAAFLYSKGSERMHLWILRQPTFGPLVLDWSSNGVIRPSAKAMSTILMTLTLAYPLYYRDFHWALKVVVAGIGLCTMTFVLTRPSYPKESLPPVEPIPRPEP